MLRLRTSQQKLPTPLHNMEPMTTQPSTLSQLSSMAQSCSALCGDTCGRSNLAQLSPIQKSRRQLDPRQPSALWQVHVAKTQTLCSFHVIGLLPKVARSPDSRGDST